MQRYADLGVKAYDTGQDGAVTFLLTQDQLNFLGNYRTKMYLRDFR